MVFTILLGCFLYSNGWNIRECEWTYGSYHDGGDCLFHHVMCEGGVLLWTPPSRDPHLHGENCNIVVPKYNWYNCVVFTLREREREKSACMLRVHQHYHNLRFDANPSVSCLASSPWFPCFQGHMNRCLPYSTHHSVSCHIAWNIRRFLYHIFLCHFALLIIPYGD